MSIEANKGIVRRFLDEVYNQHHVDSCVDILDEDYINFERQWSAMFTAAFPDLNMTVEQMIGEGDQVVAHVTVRGTHTGELKGDLISWLTPPLPPTGKKFAVQGIFIYQIVHGRLVFHGHVAQADWLGLLRQLGAVPTPA